VDERHGLCGIGLPWLPHNLHLTILDKAEADGFVLEAPKTSAARAIADLAALETVTKAFEEVQFHIFDTHGGPGELQLRDKTLIGAGSLGLFAAKNPRLMAANSRILFQGCNIGEGAKGELFMDSIGKSFFKGKGGFVGAATSSTAAVTFGPFVVRKTHIPFWGGIRVFRYDATGARVGAVEK
jgi:hypothetical protein